MNPITVAERKELRELEAVIEEHIHGFLAVGTSLWRIREAKLYRATHETFEEYCKQRWDMTRRYANYQIAAALAAHSLGTNVLAPTRESQVRPLLALKQEERPQAWASAIELAREEGCSHPLARHVYFVVNQMNDGNEPDPRPIVAKAVRLCQEIVRLLPENKDAQRALTYLVSLQALLDLTS